MNNRRTLKLISTMESGHCSFTLMLFLNVKLCNVKKKKKKEREKVL